MGTIHSVDKKTRDYQFLEKPGDVADMTDIQDCSGLVQIVVTKSQAEILQKVEGIFTTYARKSFMDASFENQLAFSQEHVNGIQIDFEKSSQKDELSVLNLRLYAEKYSEALKDQVVSVTKDLLKAVSVR